MPTIAPQSALADLIATNSKPDIRAHHVRHANTLSWFKWHRLLGIVAGWYIPIKSLNSILQRHMHIQNRTRSWACLQLWVSARLYSNDYTQKDWQSPYSQTKTSLKFEFKLKVMNYPEFEIVPAYAGIIRGWLTWIPMLAIPNSSPIELSLRTSGPIWVFVYLVGMLTLKILNPSYGLPLYPQEAGVYLYYLTTCDYLVSILYSPSKFTSPPPHNLHIELTVHPSENFRVTTLCTLSKGYQNIANLLPGLQWRANWVPEYISPELSMLRDRIPEASLVIARL